MFRESDTSGFSMIELALALVLLGLMVGTGLQAYKIYAQKHAVYVTQGLSLPVQVALQNYVALNNRYPCPADPSLLPSDNDAGVEVCEWDATLSIYKFKTPPPPPCTPNTPVCHTPPQADAPVLPGGATKSRVLIGSIPYVTLGISSRETYDGWGRQLGYAVTDAFATNDRLNPMPEWGTITLTDKNNYSVSPTAASPDGTQKFLKYKKSEHPFLVWSYGSGQAGAYNTRGTKTRPCVVTGAVTLDSENCDNDSVFLSALYPANDVDPAFPLGSPDYECKPFKPCSIRGAAAGANFYDTYILFYMLNSGADSWSLVSVAAGTDKARNTGQGKVGIGTPYPKYTLDVAGSVHAPMIVTERVCDLNGNNCFNTEIIGKGEIGCSNYAMRGIVNGAAVCLDTIGPGKIPAETCPAGKVAGGISSTGDLTCVSPP